MRPAEVLGGGRVTPFAYAVQGLYGFLLYGSGSVVVLTRREQGLSLTEAGALSAALAAGAVAGGALAGRAMARRHPLFLLRSGAVWLAVGAGLLAVPGLPGVLVGLATVGAAGGVVLAANAVLVTGQHGARGGRAMVDVSLLSATAGSVAAASFAAAAALGAWRVALLTPLLMGMVLAVALSRADSTAGQLCLAGPGAAAPSLALPEGAPEEGTTSRVGRSAQFSIIAVVVAALELRVVYWVADLVLAVTGVDAAADVALPAFTTGLLAGRLAGRFLAADGAAAARLLLASLALLVLCTSCLLLVGHPSAALAGVASAGFAAGPVYPLACFAAVRSAGRHGPWVSGLTTSLSALAVLVAPPALAVAGDRVGLRVSFVCVPALAAGALAVCAAAVVRVRPL